MHRADWKVKTNRVKMLVETNIAKNARSFYSSLQPKENLLNLPISQTVQKRICLNKSFQMIGRVSTVRIFTDLFATAAQDQCFYLGVCIKVQTPAPQI